MLDARLRDLILGCVTRIGVRESVMGKIKNQYEDENKPNRMTKDETSGATE